MPVVESNKAACVLDGGKCLSTVVREGLLPHWADTVAIKKLCCIPFHLLYVAI